MKRKALLITAAAAAVAAIVALTAGIDAGTAHRSNQPGGDDLAAFIACMASHGVQVPGGDPSVVKPWVADHQGDPAVRAALEACTGGDDSNGGSKTGGSQPGPTTAELVACLEQHGVDVPSDVKQTPDALKPWLVGVMDQPSISSAVEDCTGGPPSNGKSK